MGSIGRDHRDCSRRATQGFEKINSGNAMFYHEAIGCIMYPQASCVFWRTGLRAIKSRSILSSEELANSIYQRLLIIRTVEHRHHANRITKKEPFV